MSIQASKRGRNETGGATAEPVTLAEVKSQLRIDVADEDTLLNRIIRAATDYTETITARSLIEGTCDLYMNDLPSADYMQLKIPIPPLISITSIKYYDQSDVEQTWDSAEYVVDTDQDNEGLVYPGRNYSWPSVRDFPKSVHIEYQAGYADSAASPVDEADNVPHEIKQAVLLLIGHMYENREVTSGGVEIKTVPMGYMSLVENYRVR